MLIMIQWVWPKQDERGMAQMFALDTSTGLIDTGGTDVTNVRDAVCKP